MQLAEATLIGDDARHALTLLRGSPPELPAWLVAVKSEVSPETWALLDQAFRSAVPALERIVKATDAERAPRGRGARWTP